MHHARGRGGDAHGVVERHLLAGDVVGLLAQVAGVVQRRCRGGVALGAVGTIKGQQQAGKVELQGGRVVAHQRAEHGGARAGAQVERVAAERNHAGVGDGVTAVDKAQLVARRGIADGQRHGAPGVAAGGA